jgi:hypothetical protein
MQQRRESPINAESVYRFNSLKRSVETSVNGQHSNNKKEKITDTNYFQT